jgi:hypothetical protein
VDTYIYNSIHFAHFCKNNGNMLVGFERTLRGYGYEEGAVVCWEGGEGEELC